MKRRRGRKRRRRRRRGRNSVKKAGGKLVGKNQRVVDSFSPQHPILEGC